MPFQSVCAVFLTNCLFENIRIYLFESIRIYLKAHWPNVKSGYWRSRAFADNLAADKTRLS